LPFRFLYVATFASKSDTGVTKYLGEGLTY